MRHQRYAICPHTIRGREIMQLRCGNEHLLFPTPIWEYHFDDCESFNETLAQNILGFDWDAYRQEHGIARGDSLDSRSEDTFIPLDHAVGIMVVLQEALRVAEDVAAQYGWCLETHDLKVDEYWANVNHVNDYNMRHDHAPSHLSGVYYVCVPEHSGDIRFFDERKIKGATEPNANITTTLSRDCYTFHPRPGTLLIFPSWLEHLVGQNKSDSSRISISFNINLVSTR